ncbi:MAG: M23 family metallopeptidase [Oscillospiraceae bacterium]|nr:M23 family metallopeptidase [Oscillospiraceae bacterium]
MSNQKKFSAKGYYIALVLCAAAIGVSGYLYYRNLNQPEADVPAAVTQQELPEAAATAPAGRKETVPTGETETMPKEPMKTAAPVEGELVAEYAMECLSYNATTRDWRVHGGMDLAAEAGTEVKAAADGEVYTVYEDPQMGMTVVIRHEDGYTTHYASLGEDVAVKAGDKVALGQTIGTVGNTALMESALPDHVCFRVTLDGETIDPAEFLN